MLLQLLADYLIYPLFIYAAYRGLRAGRPRMLIQPLATYLLSATISALVPHPRPYAALGLEPLISGGHGNSFPSDHSSLAFAIALTQGGWTWLVAWTIAIGRIVALVHWPFDVLGSLALALAVNWLYSWREQNASRNKGASQRQR